MKSFEQRLLSPTDSLLNQAARDVNSPTEADSRLLVLESTAAIFGGWDLQDYLDIYKHGPVSRLSLLTDWGERVSESILETKIPPSLALSALSRELVPLEKQRRNGAYYTDWRLAELLATDSVGAVSHQGPWIDPACGTGILLAAAAKRVPRGRERDSLIANQLVGADLSHRALRGARLSVASLTSNIDAIASFSSHLLEQDSLKSKERWKSIAPNGAALVIANPPWEKLKASRYEHAKRSGIGAAYGSGLPEEIDTTEDKLAILEYIRQVAEGSHFQGPGEYDLYKLFTELSFGLVSEDGVLALLLPAGLIRSQGTEQLRREICIRSSEISLAVMENRQAYFSIDSRFKFMALTATVSTGPKQPIQLKVGDKNGSLPIQGVAIDRAKLTSIRPDLTIPEVRSTEEWNLYSRLSLSAEKVGDPKGPWHPAYKREIDMTRDAPLFQRECDATSIPLLEGRSIGQFRYRAKTYQSGRGRSAVWKPQPLQQAELRTQWHISIDDIRPAISERVQASRIGFCDIAGQTNERSLVAARIPANFACGNKVPTLSFQNGDRDLADLFLALANSVVVDWMLRRTLTTTINFFIMDNLPLPKISTASPVGAELIELSRRLTAAEGDPEITPLEVAKWRGRIDALVAAEWGLSLSDMRLVLSDFPLLDRGQPPLAGEPRSTITHDCILSELSRLLEIDDKSHNRFVAALQIGAIPYIPEEYS